MLNIGSAIKRCRKQRGVLQEDLAEKVGVIGTYLSAVENNRREPSIGLLRKISAALDVPVEVLFWESVELDATLSVRDRDVIQTAKTLVAQLKRAS